MELLRPLVKNLIFQVYTRPLHPELFEICAEQKVRKLGHHAKVQLTSTGHVITWSSRDRFVTEVLGADDGAMPGSRWIDLKPHLGHSPVLKMLPGQMNQPGLTYQACFSSESLTDEVFYHMHDEILEDGRKHGMLIQIPTGGTLPALGLVILEGRPDCFLTHAFHTFPEERTIVKSQSLIEIKSVL